MNSKMFELSSGQLDAVTGSGVLREVGGHLVEKLSKKEIEAIKQSHLTPVPYPA